MKLRHVSEFVDYLNEEWSWRFHELTTMKLFIQKEKKEQKSSLYNRSGVLLLYAHWEGFIKKTGDAYINFVSYQKNTHGRSKLASNFVALDIIQIYERMPKPDFFYMLPNYFMTDPQIDIPRNGVVSTKSNLNFKRFKNVVNLLGLDIVDFRIYEKKN